MSEVGEVMSFRAFLRSLDMGWGTERDADDVISLYRRVGRQQPPWFVRMPTDPEDISRWLLRGGYLDFHRNLHFLVRQRGRLVADVFASRVENPAIGLHGIAHVNLVVDPEWRWTGVPVAIIRYGKEELLTGMTRRGVRRIVAHILRENRVMIHFVTRMGMWFEGVLRDHMRGGDGYYHDVLIYASLVDDRGSCPQCTSERAPGRGDPGPGAVVHGGAG